MRRLLASIWKALHMPSNLQLGIMRVVNDEFLIGITGIIFNEQNEVLLVKQTYRQMSWSLPGGYLKAREHPTEGLEREIKEETNFTVSIIDKPLRIRTDRSTGRLDICYIGTYIGGEFKKNEEVDEYGFFAFDSLPPLLKSQTLFIKEALEQRQIPHTSVPVLVPKQTFMQRMINLMKTEN